MEQLRKGDGYIPRIFWSSFSNVLGSVPRSPALTIYKGHLKRSAIPSAVNVLPVPGGPWSTATRPLPFPTMMSSMLRDGWNACELTNALTIDFWLSGRTRESKAPSFQTTSLIPETVNSSHSFSLKANPSTTGLAMRSSSSENASSTPCPSAPNFSFCIISSPLSSVSISTRWCWPCSSFTTLNFFLCCFVSSEDEGVLRSPSGSSELLWPPHRQLSSSLPASEGS